MGDNDLIKRGVAREILRDELDDIAAMDEASVDNIVDSIPSAPHEMSTAEESRLRVSWRWLEDFAREYKSEQYAEFILAAKRAYVSSIEKMDGQWVQEHPETNMMTAKYALPRIDFKEGSDK